MNSFGSKTRLTCLALAVMTATTPLTTQAQAGDPPKVEKTAPKPAAKPEVWKLTVHAKAAQSPALEFSLITRPADQTPGNAAPMYLLAASQAERVKETPVDPAELQRKGLPAAETNELQDYYQSEVPIDRLPVADVKALLAAYDPLFQSFEVAGTRENCNWNLPIRELGFQTTLTHLNGARRLANIVATRARMETAGGEFTLAIRDLRGIFQLGRNLANEGVLIQALVGTGIGAVGANGVREMIQRPDSPNLYWPLATLPRPFISMRDTIEWEHTALLATFPQLRKARTGSFTADDWANLVNNLPNMGNAPPAQNVPPPASATIGPAAAGAMLYPEAKQYLLSRGVAEATVDAMPAPEVLGRYVAEQYQTMFDEMVKWTALPFWQSIGGMQRIEQDLRHPPGAPANPRAELAEGPAATMNLLLMLAIPSVSSAAYSEATLDRQIAVLQTIEAIRHFAATHDGKAPATLDELKDMPAPIDPITGKPFAYHVEGNMMTLDSPPGLPSRHGLRVEVTLVK